MSDNFVLVKYNPTHHQKIIKEWLLDRNLNDSLSGELPKVGWIIFKEGEAVASAFLRECEGNVLILDSIISNPKCSLYRRHLALEVLFESALLFARHIGCPRVLGFSVNKGTIKRSKKHGFIEQPHKLLSINLS